MSSFLPSARAAWRGAVAFALAAFVISCGGGGADDEAPARGMEDVAPLSGDALQVDAFDMGEKTGKPRGDADVVAAEPTSPRFGLACRGHEDCDGGWCVRGPDGLRCTEECVDRCPTGWTCRGEPLFGEGERTSVCVPLEAAACLACKDDGGCAATTRCVDGRCLVPCSVEHDGCPVDSTCAGFGEDGGVCFPDETDACCAPAVAGAETPCSRTNEHGTCAGTRRCSGADGWGACEAPLPAAEICDGADNDCDGETDEGLGALCACGDGVCHGQLGEEARSCPSDCAAPGDGICSPGENPVAVPEDCCRAVDGGVGCGDGTCLGFACGEDPDTCPEDCGTACGADSDGDGHPCDRGESPQSCPQDCKHQVCGNGLCEPTDGGPDECPQDCAAGCGDCVCNGGETFASCPADCGYCGDDVCSPCALLDEAATCPKDCEAPSDEICDGVDNDHDGETDEGTCDDGDPCTRDRCDGGSGSCTHTAVADGAACDDDDACTVSDICVGGACEGLPQEGCCRADDDCPDDGDLCNGTPTCDDAALNPAAWRCIVDPVTVVLCDEDQAGPCEAVRCEPTTGACTAVAARTGEPCGEADPCHAAPLCDQGACADPVAIDCDDGDDCTDDACDPEMGCMHTPSGREGCCSSAEDCDDGKTCTEDVCDPATSQCSNPVIDAMGCCANDARCDDGVACTDDRCDPMTWTCVHEVSSDEACCAADADCDDGKACTVDRCDPGTSRCTNPVIDQPGCCANDVRCDDGSDCTVDRCDPMTWTCAHDVREEAGCCRDHADCDDGMACTEDVCDVPVGTCTNPVLDAPGCCANDAGCDDGRSCTLDRCDPSTWTCVHDPNPAVACCEIDADCDDGNECTLNACHPTTKSCSVHTSSAAGCCDDAADCDDGNACTDEVCDADIRTCRYSTSSTFGCCEADADCADADACTRETCSVAQRMCVIEALSAHDCCREDAHCDDGVACTDDRCERQTGACSSTPRIGDGCCLIDADCDDGQAFTFDSCDAATWTCAHASTVGDACRGDGDCDDGEACTLDRCDVATGACSHDVAALPGCCRAAADCDDHIACTDDRCDPTTNRCVHEAKDLPGCCDVDADCDDGSDCTLDRCLDTTRSCIRTISALPGCCATDAACDDGHDCTLDRCDLSVGQCVHDVAGLPGCCAEVADCDDGSACTNDTCDPETRSCSHPPVDAPGCCGEAADCIGTPNLCHAFACDPDLAACVEVPAPAGTECAPGDACRNPYVCDGAGACVDGGLLDCDDGDPCTTDSCHPIHGCTNTPAADGSCCAADADCDDGEVCTVDTCDAGSGTCSNDSSTTNGALCDADGDPCTVNDQCEEGRCVVGAPWPCDDGVACTVDSCSPMGVSIECVHEPAPGWCVLGTECVADGTPHPTAACQVCDAATDPRAWSARRDETPCDADGDACTAGDACFDGACVAGAPADCSDGNPCTTDTCVALGSQDFRCTSTIQQDRCVILGVCYVSGEKNPANPCEACDPEVATEAWTARTGAIACDADGDGCTVGDACIEGRCVAGTPADCDDGFACTEDRCHSTGASTHACNSSIADDRCLIDGQCRERGDLSPTTCSACLPEQSKRNWSILTQGTACEDGDPCTDGEVCNGQDCSGGGARVCPAAAGDCQEAYCDAAAGGCTVRDVADGTWCAYAGHPTAGECTEGRCLQRCTPRTCADYPGACSAAADDGCDGTIDCSGTCPGGASCIDAVCAAAGCGDGQCSADEDPGRCPTDCPLPGFVHIPAGQFTMGSPSSEPGSNSTERPQREVHLTRGYWMRETEITVADWEAVFGEGTSPAYFPDCGADCPVDQVSWWEAAEWCNRTSRAEGLDECYVLEGCTGDPGAVFRCSGVRVTSASGSPLDCTGYRLPTEAEWEYAARAGSSTGFWNGQITSINGVDGRLGEVAWYRSNSQVTAYHGIQCPDDHDKRCGVHPAASKPANPFGLHGVHGNVTEWVWDYADFQGYAARPDPDIDPLGPAAGSSRMIRGGSFRTWPSLCRSAFRSYDSPGSGDQTYGFRPVRTIDPTAAAARSGAEGSSRP